MQLNDALLAMKAYAPYHHLYCVAVIMSELNKMSDLVPDPAKTLDLLVNNQLLNEIIDMAGTCLNGAFENASSEATDSGRIFSPQNWVKAKGSLKDIRNSVRNSFMAMKLIPAGKDQLALYQNKLAMEKEYFEARWSAD